MALLVALGGGLPAPARVLPAARAPLITGTPLPASADAGAAGLAATSPARSGVLWSQDGPTHLLIVVGLGGEELLRRTFHEWAMRLRAAAIDAGVAEDRVVYLGEDPELDPAAVDDVSRRENVAAALARIDAEAGPGDRVVIVLIGHGSGSGQVSRFNMPGPDLTASDFAELLAPLGDRRVAFINTASSSGDFIGPLSGPGRVVITATRDIRQYDQTVFPRYFVDAFGVDVADLDKNGAVSLLEAYEYATREVKRHYESDGRMLTETAQLDDNGDGLGTHEPLPSEADGELARTFFLGGGMAAADAAAVDDPNLRALLAEKQDLERRIEELKRIKDSMEPDLYLRELEALLVKLAVTDRQIREKGGSDAGGAEGTP